MTAPMVVEGAMTGVMFLAYIEQCLVLTLPRNDIVVMDSCRAHMGPPLVRRLRKRTRSCATCRNTRPTSIQSNCLTANSRRPSVRSRRELLRASLEQFAHSSHSSVRANVPTNFRHAGYASMLPEPALAVQPPGLPIPLSQSKRRKRLRCVKRCTRVRRKLSDQLLHRRLDRAYQIKSGSELLFQKVGTLNDARRSGDFIR
jgi:hypothetical protein